MPTNAFSILNRRPRYNALGGVIPDTLPSRGRGDIIGSEDAAASADASAFGAPAPGTLPGAPAFGYAGAYGGIPQVPSPGVSQGAAIGANLGNMGQLFNLAGQTNVFNNQQALAGLQANLPGYD